MDGTPIHRKCPLIKGWEYATISVQKDFFKCRTKALERVIPKEIKEPGDVRQGMRVFNSPVDLHTLGSLTVLVGSYHLHLSVWGKLSRSPATYQLESHRCEYLRVWSMGSGDISGNLKDCGFVSKLNCQEDWLIDWFVKQSGKSRGTDSSAAGTTLLTSRLPRTKSRKGYILCHHSSASATSRSFIFICSRLAHFWQEDIYREYHVSILLCSTTCIINVNL